MKARQAVLTTACSCLLAFGADSFTVAGRLQPETHASVSLHGVTSPFAASTLTDPRGRFRFPKIEAGAYTLIVFVPGLGETRSTIDVGPGSADTQSTIEITVQLDQSRMEPDSRSKVSVRELSIPEKARREYAAADAALGKRDTASAIAHLTRAVEIAPQFSVAWNHLGTIMYKTSRYPEAADDFRKALIADPNAYEPLVNLGGVLLNLGRIEEAWDYNVHAVLRRPKDALANSQLGMTYFEMGKADLALKYLNEARKLDPGHFSHPQLLAAEIYLRRKQWAEAGSTLEEFLGRHPDWPQAAKMRASIERLRSGLPPE